MGSTAVQNNESSVSWPNDENRRSATWRQPYTCTFTCNSWQKKTHTQTSVTYFVQITYMPRACATWYVQHAMRLCHKRNEWRLDVREVHSTTYTIYGNVAYTVHAISRYCASVHEYSISFTQKKWRQKYFLNCCAKIQFRFLSIHHVIVREQQGWLNVLLNTRVQPHISSPHIPGIYHYHMPQSPTSSMLKKM